MIPLRELEEVTLTNEEAAAFDAFLSRLESNPAPAYRPLRGVPLAKDPVWLNLCQPGKPG